MATSAQPEVHSTIHHTTFRLFVRAVAGANKANLAHHKRHKLLENIYDPLFRCWNHNQAPIFALSGNGLRLECRPNDSSYSAVIMQFCIDLLTGRWGT